MSFADEFSACEAVRRCDLAILLYFFMLLPDATGHGAFWSEISGASDKGALASRIL